MLKRAGIALAAFATMGAAPVANNYKVDEPMARPADARLVWSDEFDGVRLDPRKWSGTSAWS